jgi:hypothetical protein
MNKEQEKLVDEAHKNFEKWYNEHSGKEDYTGYFVPDKEEFIRLIKTDDLFSEKWGLTIEERELSEDERYDLCAARKSKMTAISEEDYIKYNIPTKIITIKYNDKKIESYE